jgi:NAD-dependent SIR2 family protein deacetylase
MEELHSLLQQASGFLICTGAGMSADSGIPVYCRDDGSCGPDPHQLDAIYPGLEVADIHDFGKRAVFEAKALLLWRYFFDLRQRFVSATPHSGYRYLDKIIASREYYVVTSNVDSLHLRGGSSSDRLIECHGSLLTPRGDFRLQCARGSECHTTIWPWMFSPAITKSADITPADLPRCPQCDATARPNYLSFNDETCLVHPFTWESPSRAKMIPWLEQMKNQPLVVFEIGVGETVKTIKNRSRKTWRDCPNSILIRINPSPDPEPLPERYYNVTMTCQDGMRICYQAMNAPQAGVNVSRGVINRCRATISR